MSTCHTTPLEIETERSLYDSPLVFVAGLLMTLGVAMVYSASVTVQGSAFDWDHWWNTPLRQAVFAIAGFVVMVAAAHVDYRMFAWHKRHDGWRAGLLWLLVFGLLVAVLVPGIGRQALGARRAIVIPGLAFGFQPSELAKVILVVWLAALLSRPAATAARSRRYPLLRQRDADHAPSWWSGLRRGRGAEATPYHDIRDFRTGYAPAVLSCAALIGLTAIEDFGTAALMGAVMIALLLVAGARWMHLGLTGLLAAVAGAALILVKPHRVQRIVTWWSEAPDAADAGYQINQAMLAIGSGGWWGRGLGAGVRKYGYLPQDHNDFILAIICEELGVIGGLVVIGLFMVFVIRGWRLARGAPDRFGQLLAVGLTLMIGLQAAFNIGVVTNSVPTKGISLPFVSAGGSGVIFLGLAAGLLASVARHGPHHDAQATDCQRI